MKNPQYDHYILKLVTSLCEQQQQNSKHLLNTPKLLGTTIFTI